jgi:hypothetical protein
MFAQLTGVRRRLLRQQEGKGAELSSCVIGAQSAKTSANVPARKPPLSTLGQPRSGDPDLVLIADAGFDAPPGMPGDPSAQVLAV